MELINPTLMRVAILGDYPLDPERITGGVEAVVSYLAAELSRDPTIDVHVLALKYGLARRRVVQHEAVTVHYLPASYRFANLTHFLLNKLRLWRELSDLAPDVVHAHTAGEYAGAARLSGRPFVLTPHGIRFIERGLYEGWVDRYLRAPLTRREEVNQLRRAPHLILITPYIQRVFQNDITGQVHHLENPVPGKFFAVPDSAESGRILFLGHVRPLKGVHHLIAALPSLPGCHLYLAGPVADDERYQGRPYGDVIRAQIQAGRLHNRVHLLGSLSEPELLEEYARCSLVVLPSIQECAPMVIQQAMAAGKPVIGTRVGGVPDLVAHERTGLLVEPGDVEGLVQAITRLLEDEPLRRQMGAAAREEARRRFHVTDIARRTRDVYIAVLEDFRTREGIDGHARDFRITG